jgi:glycosyltransferase involved in cell wall biosynthesis
LNRQDTGQPRVCMLIESYAPVVGGMEAQARSLAAALKALGHPVFVITRRPDKALKAHDTIDGISVIRVRPVGVNSRLRWPMFFFAMAALVRHRKTYDIVFVPGFRALGIPAVIAAKLLKKSCVLKAENNGELSGAFFEGGLARVRLAITAWPIRRLIGLRNRALRQADAFVSMSSDITREYLAHGVAAARIASIPQTVDTERFRPATAEDREALRTRLELPIDRRILVFTGRLVSWKGLPLLLRAWRAIHPRHPDTLLLLVGGGSADIYNCEDELKAFVREHGLADSVRFTGDVDHVQDYLRASDVFVFPTLNEAFGVSLIEAMACGLPVVSTDNGGIKDIITHRTDGLVARTGDEASLCQAIEEILEKPEQAESLGNAARQTATEKYALARVGSAYANMFEKCFKTQPL